MLLNKTISDLLPIAMGPSKLDMCKATFYQRIKHDPTFPPRIYLAPQKVYLSIKALNIWLESKFEGDKNRKSALDNFLLQQTIGESSSKGESA